MEIDLPQPRLLLFTDDDEGGGREGVNVTNDTDKDSPRVCTSRSALQGIGLKLQL